MTFANNDLARLRNAEGVGEGTVYVIWTTEKTLSGNDVLCSIIEEEQFNKIPPFDRSKERSMSDRVFTGSMGQKEIDLKFEMGHMLELFHKPVERKFRKGDKIVLVSSQPKQRAIPVIENESMSEVGWEAPGREYFVSKIVEHHGQPYYALGSKNGDYNFFVDEIYVKLVSRSGGVR